MNASVSFAETPAHHVVVAESAIGESVVDDEDSARKEADPRLAELRLAAVGGVRSGTSPAPYYQPERIDPVDGDIDFKARCVERV